VRLALRPPARLLKAARAGGARLEKRLGMEGQLGRLEWYTLGRGRARVRVTLTLTLTLGLGLG
jgi:hypothetical protein